MIAPILITYAELLANIQENDARAFGLLGTGEEVATTDETEAGDHKAVGLRLFNGGLLLRYRQAIEVRGGEIWYVSDGVPNPAAIPYIAQAVTERAMLAQNPPE